MPRLTMSLFGGFALIAQMLIMDLRPIKLTSLLTTSVFVIAIAIYFGYNRLGTEGHIGATTASAAVMVVFAGTTTPSSDLSKGKIVSIAVGVVSMDYLASIPLFKAPAAPEGLVLEASNTSC
jgi:peptidoglycan/LPS O-acetylase OafA/YrhL